MLPRQIAFVVRSSVVAVGLLWALAWLEQSTVHGRTLFRSAVPSWHTPPLLAEDTASPGAGSPESAPPRSETTVALGAPERLPVSAPWARPAGLAALARSARGP